MLIAGTTGRIARELGSTRRDGGGLVNPLLHHHAGSVLRPPSGRVGRASGRGEPWLRKQQLQLHSVSSRALCLWSC